MSNKKNKKYADLEPLFGKNKYRKLKQQDTKAQINKKKSQKSRGNSEPYIAKKKQFGQHFLRKQSVVDSMIDQVRVTPNTTVMEIGCGDGFLTRAILEQTACKQLKIFEIDPEWAEYISNTIHDDRIEINITNILDVDLAELTRNKPLVLLANLPYQITFPLFFLFHKFKNLFTEAVVMIQEETAQKIVAQSGRSYSHVSLFLQHVFEVKLLDKIEPGAFSPPPKVFSRLLYFKPKPDDQVRDIPNEKKFWEFVKACFLSPRQTLKNNLRNSQYRLETFPAAFLLLRAQQVSFEDFLTIWSQINQ